MSYSFTITSLFPNSTHLENNLKTGNAFIYEHMDQGTNNKKYYLVTTTHILLDDPSSIHAVLAKTVKSQQMTLEVGKFCFSRYFDVAYLLLSSDQYTTFTEKGVLAYSKYNESNTVSKVSVNFVDRSSRINMSITANYINGILSTVPLGVITHKLLPGSSGSAVVDGNNSVIGLITSLADSYDNMTLIIPFHTVINMITRKDSITGDFDQGENIYPGITTQPIQNGHMEFLPSGISNGELVINSENDKILPFDIITKCSNKTLDQSNKLSQVVLENSPDNTKLSDNEIWKVSDDWSSKYRTLPKQLLRDIIELDITANKRQSDTKVSMESNSIISNGNFYPGQQILSIDSNKKKLLHRIKAVTNTSIEIEEDVVFPASPFTLQLFHLSSVYGDLYNDPKTGKNKLFFSSEGAGLTTLTDSEYQYNIILFLVKHWAFLVISQLGNLPLGRQMIIWSKETERLLLKLRNKSFNTSEALQDVSFKILFKLLEFSSYHAMNLMNIFWQQWASIIDTDVNHIENAISEMTKKFPINEVNILDNYPVVKGWKLTFTNSVDEFKQGQIITFTGSNNHSSDFLKMKIISIDKDTKKVDVIVLEGFLIENNSSNLPIGTNTVNSIGKISLSHLKDGNSTYNAEGLSAEYYQIKPYISQINDQNMGSGETVAREIELCLREIDNVLTTPPSVSKGYQPRFFSALQSFWDHSHLTMAGIMDTLTDKSYSEAKESINLTLSNMSGQEHLSTWNFRRVLARSVSGGC